MRKKNKQKRGMKWLEMNLTKMDFPDDSFSVVLDKVSYEQTFLLYCTD